MTRDALGDGLGDGLRDVPHTTPHHTYIRTTSSRGMALARLPLRETVDLASVIVSIRSDWKITDVAKAIQSDDRPWRTVVLASIRGAADPDIRHPNGLRYVNANGGDTTPVPPPPAHRRAVSLCPHGAESGLCALCRNGVTS